MKSKNNLFKPFSITSVSRADLEAKGFDVKAISDSQMETLASKMADDYVEQMFWISMSIIAEELGFPKSSPKLTCRK